jgi:tetratricopeptide (TPR) repeat protein
VQINSLSEGMQSRGLGQILKDAEDLVRQGKYKEAMDQYNNAAVIVPNNPMILLGRADAELGANLYARAENDLREAFAADTALMMAKINLKDLIGPKRIDEIQADLQQVAEKDQSNETPVFLLAYVDYNTDQISKVAGRLELAERINGGKDPLIESLFQHWNLTSTTQPAAGK